MAQVQDPAVVAALLSLVAHDLRNPLSALQSNVGYLESTVGSQGRELREALVDVGSSCGSLKHLIDNLELLGLALLERTPEFERVPLSLWDMAGDVARRLEAIAESYGVRVTLEGERQKGPWVLANRDMFSRCLSNLVLNAIQNAGSSSGVTLLLSQDAAWGAVHVLDGGAVLADALELTAFTAEGQLLCKGDPRGRYGKGLGLFASRVAAELAGAEVSSGHSADGRNLFILKARLVQNNLRS
ncbi:MAG TPA: HAMP domain-containing sensor histidine kinase [Polyangiaceae bacterium]|nr:HAMP domain-containing sensor histidine kinase [Polyangiaceae bacterium]